MHFSFYFGVSVDAQKGTSTETAIRCESNDFNRIHETSPWIMVRKGSFLVVVVVVVVVGLHHTTPPPNSPEHPQTVLDTPFRRRRCRRRRRRRRQILQSPPANSTVKFAGRPAGRILHSNFRFEMCS